MERTLILSKNSQFNQVSIIRPTQQDRVAALALTLAEVRELRDESLRDNPGSRAGLALAQISLVLERIQRGIPSGRESFRSLLRAARLTEREKVGTEV